MTARIAKRSTLWLLAFGVVAQIQVTLRCSLSYNPTANTWDVSNYNSANADILLEDTTNPTSGHPMRQIFIGQVDKDHGAALSAYRTQG